MESRAVDELRRRFAQYHCLSFDKVNGLVRAHVAVPSATATIFLQGAHLVAWQPTGQSACIYFSRKSELAPGKPLRGGIPIVFPWFATDKKGDRVEGHPGPTHGFARIQDWDLSSVKCDGEDAVVTFTLGPTAMSRSMGFDHFSLNLVFRIGRKLELSLEVKNLSGAMLKFEEAFHTYLHIADIHEVKVEGLEPTSYIDKTDNFQRKPAENSPIVFTKTIDRIYENTTASCVVLDGAAKRKISVAKSGSDSTVVWNPFRELPDLGEWEWHEMVAVETANVENNAVSLGAQASAKMSVTITVEKALPQPA